MGDLLIFIIINVINILLSKSCFVRNILSTFYLFYTRNNGFSSKTMDIVLRN